MKKSPHTDEEILALIKGSTEDRENAMKIFFKDQDLKQVVIQTIIKKGGTKEDAEDAFQDAYLHFSKHLLAGSFKGKGKSLRAFYFGISIRVWLDNKKSGYRTRTIVVEDILEFDNVLLETPELKLITSDRKETLSSVLNRIGEKCKQLILLRLKGFSGKEITSIMGFSSPNMVKKERLRCMKKLRSLVFNDSNLQHLLKNI